MKPIISNLVIYSLLSTIVTFSNAQSLIIFSEETNDYITQFSKVNETEKKNWRDSINENTEGDDKNDQLIVNWIQPSNQKNLCRIFASTIKTDENIWWKNKDNKIFWDGDCRGGYAYGIGREFLIVNGEISSFLADYAAIGKKPSYYLVVNYDRKNITFIRTLKAHYAGLSYHEEQTQNGKQIMINQTLSNLLENKKYQKTSAIGFDISVKKMILPNGNKYAVAYGANPANMFVERVFEDINNQKNGYSILVSGDKFESKVRQYHYLSKTNTREVTLPESYKNKLSEMEKEIDNNLNFNNNLLQEAYVAINIYKRRICKGNVQFDFIDRASCKTPRAPDRERYRSPLWAIF